MEEMKKMRSRSIVDIIRGGCEPVRSFDSAGHDMYISFTRTYTFEVGIGRQWQNTFITWNFKCFQEREFDYYLSSRHICVTFGVEADE